MISLADPRISNPVLSSLKIEPSEKVISVKETGNADSNFIITHLIKQIFHQKHKLLLVSLHNTMQHYQTVGKKLGYDLQKSVDSNQAIIIEPLRDITEKIIEDDFLNESKEDLASSLFLNIKEQMLLLSNKSSDQTYLIIDDLSHLLDLGVDLGCIIAFINYCNSLVSDNVAVVINTHVCNKIDEIISNTLQYVADVHIEVCPLRTGFSTDVTGVINVERLSGKSQYQFKAYDRGIKTFHPGESIYHLYK